MALHKSSVVRNRLLTALAPADYATLEPNLERVPLHLSSILIKAHQTIHHVLFPETGLVSTVADTRMGRIEIGLIGREGLVGIPAILGTNQSPHTYLVQGVGAALQISVQALRAAIVTRPSIFLPFGLYIQSMIVQMGQTTYANASFSIEARLARWILMTQDRAEGDELQLTHEFLSAMLGVRRPGVTCATHVLEGTGLIRNKRGQITVVNRTKLLELAGDAYQVAENEYERLMAAG